MINILQILFSSFVLLGLNSCVGDMEKYNAEFVNKYENENFDAFVNTGFLIRSNREGSLVIYISTDFKNAANKGPYVVTVEKETGVIKKTSTDLISDSVSFDKEAMHKLLPEFLKYKVYSLSVDENRNVYVRLREADKPTLIRFSDMKYKTEQYKDWEQIKSNWYENKED